MYLNILAIKIDKKKKFRVYVVLPLLPGFDNRNAIQAVQYYNLRSINLGEFSVYKELYKAGSIFLFFLILVFVY